MRRSRVAKGKSKRALADEAWERTQQMSLEPPPDLHGELAGQLDIGGQIVGESHSTPLPVVSALPDACPACGKSKGSVLTWAHMKSEEEVWRVQCFHCGHIIAVTERTWNSVREAARISFRDKVNPGKAAAKPGRETRGAR